MKNKVEHINKLSDINLYITTNFGSSNLPSGKSLRV